MAVKSRIWTGALVGAGIAVGAFTGSAVDAGAVEWVNASGNSCLRACRRVGLRPVTSGVYSNGARYFVCATNYAGEGFRPGYNLQPSWANSCTVGWGGHERSAPDYRCLCRSFGGGTRWQRY